MTSYLIRLHRSGRSFLARDDENILAAAARHSVWLPASCKSGRCGSCSAKLISGEISDPAYDGRANSVRLCVTTARSDVVVDVEELDERPVKPNKRFPATVVNVEAVPDGQSNLRLRLPRAALGNLSDGQSMKITAPVSLAELPLIVSGREGNIVTVEASGDHPGASVDAMSSIASVVGAVIQIEILACLSEIQ